MAQRIVIDAGHNGISDPGAVYNGRRESDDNLDMALAVGDILARNGFDVVYTRTGNNNQTVQQKAQLANDADADLFVSIHRNDSPYPGQYNGVQTLIFDRTGIKLPMAENINRQLEEVGYRNINVETRPNLAVLRRTRMPALLVEVGFLNSDVDNQLFDTRFQETAQAIADGIMERWMPRPEIPPAALPVKGTLRRTAKTLPRIPARRALSTAYRWGRSTTCRMPWLWNRN